MVFRVDRRHLNTYRAEAVTPPGYLAAWKDTGQGNDKMVLAILGNSDTIHGCLVSCLTDANKHLNMCAVVVAKRHHILKGSTVRVRCP